MRNFAIVCAAALALGASCPAFAADLPVKAPPVPVMAPVFSWTGFYIGGNVGGAWQQGNVSDTLLGVTFTNSNNNGVFIGGGQVGFNYQISNFVWGIEFDADWAANNNNNGVGVITPVGLIQVSSNNRWVSTAAARFGVAFDRVLLYGKAGGGWVGANNFTITNLTTGVQLTGLNNNNTTTGWLLGAGVEWAFAQNWTVKIEYDYLGLNSRSIVVPFNSPFLAGDVFTTGNRNVQMAKVGFNYLFNWGGFGPGPGPGHY
jgi:outer membrane immunogenic protein